MTPAQHTSRPIVLVPGYWLGAWAWDDVTAHLRATGHETAVLTLPGLDAASTPREGIRFADHVTAVLEALPSSEPRAVLVAHSGAGAVATAVLDAAPDRISRVVYVDSGPATDGAVPLPGLPDDVTELPLPSFEDLAAEGNSLEGLDEGVLAEFRRRAVPHPVGAIREPVVLREPRRHAVPATFVCCSFPSVTVQELVAAGEPMFAAVAELTDLEYVDLPTGHWPMWSRPVDLAELIATAARR
jgi:pimeloyl-ACP methyl ester carboxylesterase